jgi:hypothetical protein
MNLLIIPIITYKFTFGYKKLILDILLETSVFPNETIYYQSAFWGMHIFVHHQCVFFGLVIRRTW